MMEDIIVISAKYVLSAVSHAQYPEKVLPEIAFWGRSNVGKSSLINSLVKMRSLAKISSQPGKTRTINFFEVDIKAKNERKSFFLVDLPGYGYAKAGRETRKTWVKFIEEYLLNSKKLLFLCLLIDLRHDPQANDIKTLNFLLKNNIPTLVIGTKADKISKNAVQKSVKNIKEVFGEKEISVLPYSSVKHSGREELLQTIKYSLYEVK